MDDGYILGGNCSANIGGDKTEDSRGGEDYWVVKIDANGIKQWDKTFGGIDNDYLVSIQQTTDGGYILGGYSASDIGGDKTENNRDNEDLNFSKGDYWAIKINANGTKQWDKTFGGTLAERLYSLQQTADGGYILGGSSASGISGDKTEANKGNSGWDYWIVKIDANGAKQWDKTFGGTGSDEMYSLQQTADGGYILGGSSESDVGGDKTEKSRGQNDYWAVKINASGTKQWDKTFGGTSDDNMSSLQQTTDGGYVLGGTSESRISGDKTENNVGFDYWVVKIDASGLKQWDKRFAGVGWDRMSSLQQTEDGGYILGGSSTSSYGADKTEFTRSPEPICGCSAYDDFWIVKIDNNGAQQWDKTFGGDYIDEMYALEQTKDGGYILGGYSESGESGDKTTELFGYWVLKMGFCSKPTITSNISTNGVCLKDSVTLTSSPADIYLWSTGATSQSITVKQAGNYTVTMSDSANTCSATSDTTKVTYATTCSKPTSLFVLPTGTSAQLNWFGDNCAVEYQYQWRRKGTTTWNTGKTTANSKTITGLTNNTTYQWHVRKTCRPNPDLINSSYATGPEFTTLPIGPIQNNNASVSNATLNTQHLTCLLAPNPAKDITTLLISNAEGVVKVTVTDISGKKIWQSDKTSYEKVTIPLKDLASGIYMVQVKDKKETVVVSMVRE